MNLEIQKLKLQLARQFHRSILRRLRPKYLTNGNQPRNRQTPGKWQKCALQQPDIQGKNGDIRRKAAVQQWFQRILDLGTSAMCATHATIQNCQYQELLECEKPSNSSSGVTATCFERQQCRCIWCSVNCRPLRCLWFWDQSHLLIKNAAVLQPNS